MVCTAAYGGMASHWACAVPSATTVVGVVAPGVETTAPLGLALRRAGTPGRARMVEDGHGRPATVGGAADDAALCRELVGAIAQAQPMA